jgi:CheY-like chemotaxis protein
MRLYKILSIEDNEPDFELLKKALENITDINIEITNISNGQHAIDYIFKKGKYENAETPDLIVLDINLPRLNGYEILDKIKLDANYRSIPVIMFSTSSSEEDIQKSYNAHANSYVIKSFDVKTLFNKISAIGEYWLKTSEIPNTNNLFVIED